MRGPTVPVPVTDTFSTARVSDFTSTDTTEIERSSEAFGFAMEAARPLTKPVPEIWSVAFVPAFMEAGAMLVIWNCGSVFATRNACVAVFPWKVALNFHGPSSAFAGITKDQYQYDELYVWGEECVHCAAIFPVGLTNE